MSNIKKNLGHVTAYAYYKAGGGTMTEEEFTEYMADFGDAAERAVDAASEAAQSKADAQTAAATATDKADEAAASASSASGSAASAAEDASTASTAANTATGAATTATSAKNDAVSAKTAAQSAKTAAETAASTATTKAGEAATSATNAAASAQSVASSAAQITQNAEDIDALKEDFSDISSTTRNLFYGSFSNGNIDANDIISDTPLNFLHCNEYISVEASTDYALSVDATTAFTQIVLLEYTSAKVLVTRRGIRNATSNTYHKTELTTGATTAFVKFLFYNPSGAMVATGNNVQLEKGSVVTEYIPHFTAKDITARNDIIALKNISLKSSDDGQITSSSQLASLDDCENNTIYRINVPSGNTPPSEFPFALKQGLVYTIGWDSDGTNTMVQYCISLDGMQIAHRIRWGSTWGIWTLESNDPIDFGFIQKFAVIGDSYASGEIYVNSDTPSGYVVDDYYEKSWGQILARNYGATCINLSKGGLTTRTWLTDSMGLQLMLSNDPQELYFCALGHNDAGSSAYGLNYLGSLTDITSHSSSDDYADTFYGNYGRIIEKIKAHAPNAKIVMMSFAYLYNATEDAFNSAIKELAQHYGLPFMDIKTDPFYSANSIYHTGKMWSHPTAPLYAGMAKANAKLFSRTVKTYYNYFKTFVG